MSGGPSARNPGFSYSSDGRNATTVFVVGKESRGGPGGGQRRWSIDQHQPETNTSIKQRRASLQKRLSIDQHKPETTTPSHQRRIGLPEGRQTVTLQSYLSQKRGSVISDGSTVRNQPSSQLQRRRRSSLQFTHFAQNRRLSHKDEETTDDTSGTFLGLNKVSESDIKEEDGEASKENMSVPKSLTSSSGGTEPDHFPHPHVTIVTTSTTGEKMKIAKASVDSPKSLFSSEFHRIMHNFTESKIFGGFILFIILLNTAILIAQTWQRVSVRAGWYFSALDNIFAAIYIMEVVLKIYAQRARFFKDGWNIMDFSIVAFNIFDLILPLVLESVGGFNSAGIFRLFRIFRAVRAIRALRVLRTIRFLSNLQVIMATILQSMKSIGTIVALIILFMYMFAVIGRGLYADVDEKRFGNLVNAGFTLFQLLTLDDWFEIYKDITAQGKQHIMIYLLLYIIVEYFIFLNLFVAVLVDNFQITLKLANEAKKKKRTESAAEEAAAEAEDDFYAYDDDSSGSESSSSDDDEKERQITDFYPNLTQRDEHLLRQYLRILASLEYNRKLLSSQEKLLNMMVNLCMESNMDM